jgi:hypothetical protein
MNRVERQLTEPSQPRNMSAKQTPLLDLFNTVFENDNL